MKMKETILATTPIPTSTLTTIDQMAARHPIITAGIATDIITITPLILITTITLIKIRTTTITKVAPSTFIEVIEGIWSANPPESSHGSSDYF